MLFQKKWNKSFKHFVLRNITPQKKKKKKLKNPSRINWPPFFYHLSLVKHEDSKRNLDEAWIERIDPPREAKSVTVGTRRGLKSLERVYPWIPCETVRRGATVLTGVNIRTHANARVVFTGRSRRDSPRGRETNCPVLRARNLHAWNNGSNTRGASRHAWKYLLLHVSARLYLCRATIDSMPAPTATRCIRVKTDRSMDRSRLARTESRYVSRGDLTRIFFFLANLWHFFCRSWIRLE